MSFEVVLEACRSEVLFFERFLRIYLLGLLDTLRVEQCSGLMTVMRLSFIGRSCYSSVLIFNEELYCDFS